MVDGWVCSEKNRNHQECEIERPKIRHPKFWCLIMIFRIQIAIFEVFPLLRTAEVLLPQPNPLFAPLNLCHWAPRRTIEGFSIRSTAESRTTLETQAMGVICSALSTYGRFAENFWFELIGLYKNLGKTEMLYADIQCLNDLKMVWHDFWGSSYLLVEPADQHFVFCGIAGPIGWMDTSWYFPFNHLRYISQMDRYEVFSSLIMIENSGNVRVTRGFDDACQSHIYGSWKFECLPYAPITPMVPNNGSLLRLVLSPLWGLMMVDGG